MFTFKIRNGDVPFSAATGRPETVEGTLKFDQDVEENIMTEAQPNGTGAALNGLIGRVLDPFSLRAAISERITESFQYLKRIQERHLRHNRAASEVFSGVTNIVVTPIREVDSNRFDPTRYAVKIVVRSLSNQTVLTPVLGR